MYGMLRGSGTRESAIVKRTSHLSQSAIPVLGSLLTTTRQSRILLLGFGILMLGDGLQSTLLGVRASLEGFPTAVTGLIMSTFYVGFLAGALYAPRIVERVGHIRVFGALASLASAAVLIHGVVITPVTWSLLRLLSGFCLAGLYIVAESWLNDRATNRNRGQLLSIYMVVSYLGAAGGQLLLNAADPKGLELFILTSVLISVALVPLLLSAGPAPKFSAQSALSLRKLYRISPLGVVGALATGMASGALFGFGPVYAESSGLSVSQISFFMTAILVGCSVLQWPIGHLSDVLDRRLVITVVSFLSAAAAVAAVSISMMSTFTLLMIMAVFGGLSIPLYSLCIAHANDYLEPDQMVAASSGLVLASGVGAVLGPITASLSMLLLGQNGFFWWLALIHVVMGIFAVYRMAKRRARPVQEQSHYAPSTLYGSHVALELTHHGVRNGQDQG
jgi:MFS family permease